MPDVQFGYDARQLNLTAIRLQQLMARYYDSLASTRAQLNVAQGDDEVIDIPIEDMSSSVLVAFFLQIIAANNAALDEQLRALGLVPTKSAVVPTIDL
jgi:hypothetical protein